MGDIDFIEIHDKSDRDLLVAAVTRQNTILEVQHEINQRLKTLNGTVAKNVKDIENNRTLIAKHNHRGIIVALLVPLCSIIGILINCLF